MFECAGYPTFWFVMPKREKLDHLSAGYLSQRMHLMSVSGGGFDISYDTTRNKQNTAPKDRGK